MKNNEGVNRHRAATRAIDRARQALEQGQQTQDGPAYSTAHYTAAIAAALIGLAEAVQANTLARVEASGLQHREIPSPWWEELYGEFAESEQGARA